MLAITPFLKRVDAPSTPAHGIAIITGMLQESAEIQTASTDPEPEPLDALRLRVQRLEEMMTTLQDTQELEKRIVEKLGKSAAKVEQQPARRETVLDQPNTSITVRQPTPVTPVIITPPADESPWLLFDALSDFNAMWRMCFDLRYHFAWSTRVICYVLIPVILTTHIWFAPSQILLFGGILDKILALILGFFLYKALSREARRYKIFMQVNPR